MTLSSSSASTSVTTPSSMEWPSINIHSDTMSMTMTSTTATMDINNTTTATEARLLHGQQYDTCSWWDCCFLKRTKKRSTSFLKMKQTLSQSQPLSVASASASCGKCKNPNCKGIQTLPKRLFSSYSTTIIVHPCTTTMIFREEKIPLRQIRTLLHRDMEQLSITGRKIDRRFVRRFERANLDSLTCLVLNGNDLSRDQHCFRRLLSNLPLHLEQLRLSWNGMDVAVTKCLSKRVKQLKRLKHMSLCGNPIGSEGLRYLMENGNIHNINYLNFWDCDIGDNGASLLGQVLSKPTSNVEHMILDMNGITSAGIRSLSEGLKYNNTLISLDLYCNHIGDEGVEALMSSLATSRERYDDNEGSTRTDGGGGCYSRLEELSLRATHIGVTGAKSLARYLNGTCLKKLHLSHNSISDEGAIGLAETLSTNQTLQELTLSSNGLGNKSIVAFALALTAGKNQTLQRLELDGNPLVDRRGASKFVRCLQANTSLLTLSVLETTYDNHLLQDKLNFYLEANRAGRRHIGNVSIPIGAWPKILHSTTRPDHMYLFLRERPDLFLFGGRG